LVRSVQVGRSRFSRCCHRIIDLYSSRKMQLGQAINAVTGTRLWARAFSYQLERSPRSSPTVNFWCEIFLLCFTATVLTFFIAGLLYLLRFERVDNLGAYSIPSGDRPSHPIWLQRSPHIATVTDVSGDSQIMLH
jgi:hypothetical protein